ncbi:hypothetical protein ASJ80_02275 [Methanobacterium bryantii]|uniref:Uncharacterized protein n=2 Tax=Methanobacterium bryantii TaxID=2161 RepID=A0A2A2H3B7_METBR|nr:hypothetical protein ASJ80_02275 [Methanobacterium bryantii]
MKMEDSKEKKVKNQFDLICPECGVGNSKGSKNCLVCGKNLEDTVAFLEDDSFDLEISKDAIIEYRKTFWGDNRTGKVNKYSLNKIENVEFGPSSRFIFIYNGKRIVLPLKEENLRKKKKKKKF